MIRENIEFKFEDEAQQRRFHERLRGEDFATANSRGLSMAWDPIAARQKLRDMVAKQDAARGRPLTDTEKLENLRRAVARICIACGGEVEPKALCRCGRWNTD